MPRKLAASDPGFAREFAALLAERREAAEEIDANVAPILADVLQCGDFAVIEATRRYDRLDLTPATMRISAAEIAASERQCSAETLAALRLAAERIESYHRRLMPAELDYVDAQGIRLGARWRPIAAVGIYVPGGLAAYPSSVLMACDALDQRRQAQSQTSD